MNLNANHHKILGIFSDDNNAYLSSRDVGEFIPELKISTVINLLIDLVYTGYVYKKVIGGVAAYKIRV